MRSCFKLGLAAGALALGLIAAKPASAAIVNGSFEGSPDFTGWTITGNSVIVDNTFKTPPDGVLQALMSTGPQGNTGGPANPVTAASLETFLGLSAGSLTGQGAVEGSAIKQSVTVAAGDVISFKYDFATNEPTPSATTNDFGFVSVDNTVAKLADTHSVFAPTTPDLSSFALVETGYHQFSITFLSAGTFTLGFGAVDVGDTLGQSGLLVDQVVQGPGPATGPGITVGGGGGGAIPLPAGVYLMPLGMLVAGAYSMKLRRSVAC